MQNHRQRQKQATYDLLLATTRNLLEELGYEKTTMRKVAQSAGVTPGAIFKHFENKPALLAATLFDGVEEAQTKALASVPRGSPQEKVLYIFHRFLEHYASRPGLSKILVQHSLFIEGAWAARFNAQSARLIKELSLIIHQGIADKRFFPDSNAELLATALFSHYLFVLIMSCANTPQMNHALAKQLLRPLVLQTLDGVSTDRVPPKKESEHNAGS